jgi:hypothetical protein
VAGRIIACQEKQAALLGADVPAMLAVTVGSDSIDDDEASVRELRENLSVDELRTLYQLSAKGKGRATETTPTVAPASSGSNDPALDSAPNFPEPAVKLPSAIGETPREYAIRFLEGVISRCPDENYRRELGYELAALRRSSDPNLSLAHSEYSMPDERLMTLDEIREQLDNAKKSFDPVAVDWWRYQLERREHPRVAADIEAKQRRRLEAEGREREEAESDDGRYQDGADASKAAESYTFGYGLASSIASARAP